MRYGKSTDELDKLPLSKRRKYKANPVMTTSSDVELAGDKNGKLKVKRVGNAICPHCGFAMSKNGYDINRKQKYRCSRCRITRILEDEKEYFGQKEVDFALNKLRQGYSLRDIAKELGTCHTTVARNIRKFYNEAVEEIAEKEKEKEAKQSRVVQEEVVSEPEQENKAMRWDEYM